MSVHGLNHAGLSVGSWWTAVVHGGTSARRNRTSASRAMPDIKSRQPTQLRNSKEAACSSFFYAWTLKDIKCLCQKEKPDHPTLRFHHVSFSGSCFITKDTLAALDMSGVDPHKWRRLDNWAVAAGTISAASDATSAGPLLLGHKGPNYWRVEAKLASGNRK